MAAHPITLDPDLQQRLERVARREVRSPEFVVRDALEMYFSVRGETEEDAAVIAKHDAIRDADDCPAVTREQFLKEVDLSYEHYKRTGLHVTWNEVDQWLARLESGEKTLPPECHT